MAIYEKDFSDFYLSDNVYELADELLPEMADVFEVDLGDEPNAEALGRLVGAIGTKETLRDNERGARAWLEERTGSPEQALETAAEWLGRSGVQQELDRSLWTPRRVTASVDPIVITGAVANWQDRTANFIESETRIFGGTTIHVATGNRVMQTGTEQANANIKQFFNEHSRYPTETEYASSFVVPRLREAGNRVYHDSFQTTNGDEIADQFVRHNQVLLNGQLVFARVANAGIQLAVQFRNAARNLHPEVDSDPANPQIFVLTDSFPIARTEEQVANAREFQSPFTGIRQVALTGKLLVEATKED